MTEESESRKSDRRKALRNKIQQSIDLAKEENRRELLRHRIQTAKTGMQFYEKKQYPEAVQAFLTYIRILEDWKGVSEGGLNPKLFDLKRDIPELLLINSVYWHLTKLFDQTHSTGKRADFRHYLEKFILFTKGMSFQPLSAETLRKYLRHKNLIHKSDFKNAYKMLSDSKCFVATSLADLIQDSTLPLLRKFRDQTLIAHPMGRRFVKWYYRHGPTLAHWMDKRPHWVRNGAAKTLDRFVSAISNQR